MNKDSKKIEEAKKRRTVLISMSRKARILRELKPEFTNCTINEILMSAIYNRKGDLVFKKFREWKQEGYTIKKGERGYILWAQPLKELIKDNEDETEKSNFFPVCYLFSNEQVIKPQINTANNNTKESKQVPDLNI